MSIDWEAFHEEQKRNQEKARRQHEAMVASAIAAHIHSQGETVKATVKRPLHPEQQAIMDEITHLIETVHDTLKDARDLIPAEVGLETILADLQQALEKAQSF